MEKEKEEQVEVEKRERRSGAVRWAEAGARRILRVSDAEEASLYARTGRESTRTNTLFWLPMVCPKAD